MIAMPSRFLLAHERRKGLPESPRCPRPAEAIFLRVSTQNTSVKFEAVRALVRRAIRLFLSRARAHGQGFVVVELATVSPPARNVVDLADNTSDVGASVPECRIRG